MDNQKKNDDHQEIPPPKDAKEEESWEDPTASDSDHSPSDPPTPREEKEPNPLPSSPFNLMAFIFAPFYYIGYGQITKGILFFIGMLIPGVALIISVYTGFRANRELPVGKIPFNWKAVWFSAGIFALVLIWFEPLVQQRFQPKSNHISQSQQPGFESERYCNSIAAKGGLGTEKICITIENTARQHLVRQQQDPQEWQLCMQLARAAGGSNLYLAQCLIQLKTQTKASTTP